MRKKLCSLFNFQKMDKNLNCDKYFPKDTFKRNYDKNKCNSLEKHKISFKLSFKSYQVTKSVVFF